MSDIPGFTDRDLGEERVIRSVANLTRADPHAFLALATPVLFRCQTEAFGVAEANEELSWRRAVGAARMTESRPG